ncbi:hypothetical protein DFJ74DRAFT_701165 [Hyaloraphidium curvatum]|nr:hypothetical protein DFJ74DRAFT_701165 [Hyaloraphidium curvatum]
MSAAAAARPRRQFPARPAAPPAKSRTSCRNCAKLHVRCDRVLPKCSRCGDGTDDCDYPPPSARGAAPSPPSPDARVPFAAANAPPAFGAAPFAASHAPPPGYPLWPWPGVPAAHAPPHPFSPAIPPAVPPAPPPNAYAPPAPPHAANHPAWQFAPGHAAAQNWPPRPAIAPLPRTPSFPPFLPSAGSDPPLASAMHGLSPAGYPPPVLAPAAEAAGPPEGAAEPPRPAGRMSLSFLLADDGPAPAPP